MALVCKFMSRYSRIITEIRRSYNTENVSSETLDYFQKTLSNSNLMTISALKDEFQKRVGQKTWLDRHKVGTVQQDVSTTPPVLESRRMSDSFTAALIPLASDQSLQDKYVTFLGHVRLGRLMEDLDLFAGCVSLKHLTYGNYPITIVTLLVDSIQFVNSRLSPNRDIRVSGFVSWCGRSTMETELFMEQEDGSGDWQIITNARFLMALRDPNTHKAAPVNQLVANDDFERSLLQLADERRKRKRQEEENSPYKLGPNESEVKILHKLMYENLMHGDRQPFEQVAPKDGALIEKAGLSTTVFSHPEDRNRHNTVFGGYLMRIAVELSWACAWMHSHERPQLERIGDIKFHRPVAVASLLRMRSFVIYTKGQHAVVKVSAFVHDPETGDTFRTNDFHLTYRLKHDAPPVLPSSYESALMYLEGRRFLGLANEDVEPQN